MIYKQFPTSSLCIAINIRYTTIYHNNELSVDLEARHSVEAPPKLARHPTEKLLIFQLAVENLCRGQKINSKV